MNIEYTSQLKKNDLINIVYCGEIISYNCIVLKLVQDKYFFKGLIVYLSGHKRRTLDLENNKGLYIQKIN